MTILQRLKNAYKTKGLLEIFRKAFYYFIYKVNNKLTKMYVCSAKLKYGLNKKSARKQKVIVSLTSFPPRFNKICLTLKSLVLQSFKPDKIIVYLGNDTADSDITSEMREYEKYGIEFRIDHNNNFKSHKKYYYPFKEFPNEIIVTADDDLIYPKKWLLSLYKCHLKYPSCVCARRVHLIQKDSEGNLLPYNLWRDQWRKGKRSKSLLFATSGSGELFCPNWFGQEFLNSTIFMKTSPGADDVWIHCMKVFFSVETVWVKNYEVDLCSSEKKQAVCLSDSNVTENMNDKYLSSVIQTYNLKI